MRHTSGEGTGKGSLEGDRKGRPGTIKYHVTALGRESIIAWLAYLETYRGRRSGSAGVG